MEKVILLNWVAVITCLCASESCATCVDGMTEVVEGVLGDNANISCEVPRRCQYILWDGEYDRSTINSSQEATNQTSLNGPRNLSFFRISPITYDDFGTHSCWCYKNVQKSGNSPVCTVTLTPICQSEVNVNGKIILYNSSQRSSSVPQFLKVTEGDKVKFKCPENETAETNCSNAMEVKRKGRETKSAQGNAIFTNTKSTTSCRMCDNESVRIQWNTAQENAVFGYNFVKGLGRIYAKRAAQIEVEIPF